eukprot:TRINITY_DN26109_c0_g1_i1.p1 TRINITY_DN26109_c0_g1~~TRINITY_DN26109_c0_g1_i1.p1  ORF type:complete len:316 (-),score=41.96 TRINITY_DN26109_c0_g1_i1:136-1083(-)
MQRGLVGSEMCIRDSPWRIINMKAHIDKTRRKTSPARIKIKKPIVNRECPKKSIKSSESPPKLSFSETQATFQYFSEKIEFKTMLRSELWPRHKIGHTFELSIERFLPYISLTSGLLLKLWNTCVAKEVKNTGTLKAVCEAAGERDFIQYTDLNKFPEHQSRDSIFNIKGQKTPNSFLTANALQITKAEIARMCEDLKDSICRFRRSPVLSKAEAEEIAKDIATPGDTPEIDRKRGKFGEAKVLHSLPTEKIDNPELRDFIQLQYIFGADQITHKMLCKALAIIPDVSIRLYPIRSFAVVTTPMYSALILSLIHI